MKKIFPPLLSALILTLFFTNIASAQRLMDEVVVTSPRLSSSGDMGDFQRLLAQIKQALRSFDLQGDIDDLDKQEDICDLENEQKRLRCESRVLASLVGRIESRCTKYLAVPSTRSEAEINLGGARTRTEITTPQGIELYDRCVAQADRVVDSQLKTCEADFHKVNCAPNGR